MTVNILFIYVHHVSVAVGMSNHVKGSKQRWDWDVAQKTNANFFHHHSKVPLLTSSYLRPFFLHNTTQFGRVYVGCPSCHSNRLEKHMPEAYNRSRSIIYLIRNKYSSILKNDAAFSLS